MSRPVDVLAMALAVLVSASVAHAGCGTCDAKKKDAQGDGAAAVCTGEKCEAATCDATRCESSGGCPIAAAMARLPKLTYAVGDKKTCCPKEAAELVKSPGGHIHFAVADKEYETKAEAQEALVIATEKFVVAFTNPHTCPKSGKMTLAGQAQSCEKTAARTAKLMKKAMAKVKLSYLVGDKACNCPVEAGRLAKESGTEKLFVVGKQKTPCEQTARLNLAMAKYKAAVEAMVKASSKEKADEAAKKS